MLMPIFIPPPIRRTKKCNRCGLLYPKKETSCIHCSNLNDGEVATMLEARYQTNRNLGKIFIVFALLILIGMAIVFI